MGPWVRLIHPAFPAPSLLRENGYCKARAKFAAGTKDRILMGHDAFAAHSYSNVRPGAPEILVISGLWG